MKSKYNIFLFILRSTKIWSIIIGASLLLLLLFFWHNTDPNQSLADNFWAVIDPVAGIMTFFITMIILFIQAKSNWENSLEKRLAISYLFVNPADKTEILLAKIIDAYLSGEADIRPWAQSLGQQILGSLDFDMNWDDPKPVIEYDAIQKQFFKKYEVTLYLSNNPLSTNKGLEIAYNFLNRSFKHSKVEGSIEDLPIIWSRI
jgi:hypothetical protein